MNVHSIKRMAVLGVALGLLALVFMSLQQGSQETARAQLAPTPTATATPEGLLDVPTTGQIAQVSTPPIIEWKWELPYMDGDPFNGVQYCDAALTDLDGDGMCDSDDDPFAGPATPPASHNMMTVTPYLEDLPAPRLVEYWLAAEDPNGIADLADAFVQVYRPDGTLKYQLHMTSVLCADLGAWNLENTPLGAAYETGQMTQLEAELIVTKCGKNEKLIYKVTGEISKHQGCGEDRVEATAQDQFGGTATLINWFDLGCVLGLRLDFDQVVFPPLLPNTTQWLSGDMIFAPPSDTKPTIKNVGNGQMHLNLHYSEMLGVTFGKIIDLFDAQLDTELIDPIVASTPVCFTHTQGPNELGQLDLSVHPGTIPADIYQGTLDLWGSFSCL